MEEYPIVPGRGVVTETAKQLRLAYLNDLGFDTHFISNSNFDPKEINKNIESYIGSVEIPLGLAGPLLFLQNGSSEMVYAAAGTLEGALLASMNRGAKAISISGGFSAEVIHQKMIRCPLFIFNNLAESVLFKKWIETNFKRIKQIAENYSNHAKLQSIIPVITGKSVHLKFIYTTADASGQNMTTTCTWHAVLWINEHFTEECKVTPVNSVIEGNGSSDKKVSHASMNLGRGIQVIAECNLSDRVIENVLRTNAKDYIECFNQSMAICRLDGMVGYNINVANTIASIFVATGQDLASIHESGLGILNVEKSKEGLYFCLILPSLVIGTVGGGTHLPKQQEALGIMSCAGQDKVFRFAQIIAGFSLALEISTFAAIVGGQFAKAHEKMGRNKPIHWLTKSEIDREFITACMNGFLDGERVLSVEIANSTIVENGIIIDLAQRVNNKLTGFLPLEIALQDKLNGNQIKRILLKSKPLDIEVIKGLHLMASAIDPILSNLISQNFEELEYKNCHLKEICIYEFLNLHRNKSTPAYFGKHIDASREIYLFLMELLDYETLTIIHSENEPLKWDQQAIKSVIHSMHEIHDLLMDGMTKKALTDIPEFRPWQALDLYHKMAMLIITQFQETDLNEFTPRLLTYLEELKKEHDKITIKKTIVHNDFNPRNVAMRKDNRTCIYDWELAVVNFPQRDIAEFLSFALKDQFDVEEFEGYIHFHYSLQDNKYSQAQWRQAYIYSLKEYLVTRVSFYLTGKILMEFEFAHRIFLNTIRMIDILDLRMDTEKHE